MKKVDTWMPLYVADYLADTMRLTCEQHGAYLLLIMDYWRNGPPPDDDAVLASITRCSPEQWGRIRPAIQSHFQVIGGKWNHKRVDAEQDKAIAHREQKSVAGKASAAAREAQRKGNGDSTTVEMPLATVEQRQGNPSPSPSPNTKTSSSSAGADLPCPFDEIVSLYHDCMPLNPKCKVLSEARKASIRGRWKEGAYGIGKLFGYTSKGEGLEKWREFFTICNESEFLTGRTQGVNGRMPFIADLEWIMKQSNFCKIIENKYHRSAA